MFNHYPSPLAAQTAIRASGYGALDCRYEPLVGGGVQPVIVCDHIRDAETVQRNGFNARLRYEYAAD